MAPSIIYLPKWKSIYHPWGSAKASTDFKLFWNESFTSCEKIGRHP